MARPSDQVNLAVAFLFFVGVAMPLLYHDPWSTAGLATLVSSTAYASRIGLRHRFSMAYYSNLLQGHLYDNTVGCDLGAVLYVLDAAKEEDLKRTLVAYQALSTMSTSASNATGATTGIFPPSPPSSFAATPPNTALDRAEQRNRRLYGRRDDDDDDDYSDDDVDDDYTGRGEIGGGGAGRGNERCSNGDSADGRVLLGEAEEGNVQQASFTQKEVEEECIRTLYDIGRYSVGVFDSTEALARLVDMGLVRAVDGKRGKGGGGEDGEEGAPMGASMGGMGGEGGKGGAPRRSPERHSPERYTIALSLPDARAAAESSSRI